MEHNSIKYSTGTIGAISDGMQYGWTAPIIPRLQAPDSPVKITDTDILWLEQIYMLGSLLGLPITIMLVDRIGRKKCILLAASTSLTAWILIGVANRVEYLYVARLLTGLAGDVAFVASPMYVAEIADEKIRGFLSGLIYLMMLIGILVVYSLVPFVPIYVSPIVGGSILFFQLCTFPFMPNSPYFLLLKNRYDDAKNALKRLRGDRNIDEEIEEISEAVKRQKSERGRPQDVILVPSNRKALIIMIVLNAAQHMAAISVILMNLHLILDAAGSTYMSSNNAAIIFAVMMLISATFADFILDKCGRRILLISSSLLTGVSLLVMAVYFHLKVEGYNTMPVSWIPIVSVMIYAVVFKFGMGMVPIVLTAELFPSKVKAMCMTIADATYVLCALISIELYNWLEELGGIYLPFYVFAGSSVFTAFFCFIYIPETKQKTLEEIQYILKGMPYPHAKNDVKEIAEKF